MDTPLIYFVAKYLAVIGMLLLIFVSIVGNKNSILRVMLAVLFFKREACIRVSKEYAETAKEPLRSFALYIGEYGWLTFLAVAWIILLYKYKMI